MNACLKIFISFDISGWNDRLKETQPRLNFQIFRLESSSLLSILDNHQETDICHAGKDEKKQDTRIGVGDGSDNGHLCFCHTWPNLELNLT